MSTREEALEGINVEQAAFNEVLAFGTELGLNDIAKQELAHKVSTRLGAEGLSVLRILNGKIGVTVEPVSDVIEAKIIIPEETPLATVTPIHSHEVIQTSKHPVHDMPTIKKEAAKKATTRKPRRERDYATPREESPEADSVRRYLTEIGRYTLIDKEEEERLSRIVMAGLEAKRKLEDPDIVPTPGQRRVLSRLIKQGEHAKQNFIHANLRLVVSIARRYQASGLPLLDLIQEGNLGLEHAVDKFDYRKGFKFSTYATWWIRQAIGRGIANTGRTVRLPVHAGESLAQLNKNLALAVKLGVHESEVDDFVMKEMGISRKKLSTLREIQRLEPVSFNATIGESQETELQDLIGDPSSEDFIDDVLITDETARLLDSPFLEEREKLILIHHFGVGVKKPETLEQLGQRFGLTRERIRQVEAQAIQKIRRIPALEKLSKRCNLDEDEKDNFMRYFLFGGINSFGRPTKQSISANIAIYEQVTGILDLTFGKETIQLLIETLSNKESTKKLLYDRFGVTYDKDPAKTHMKMKNGTVGNKHSEAEVLARLASLRRD